MADTATVFAAIDNFSKGGVEIIDDDPKNYVFSNMFEVAARSRPYERVAVGKNFEYVIDALRAEGASPWYPPAHDEFARLHGRRGRGPAREARRSRAGIPAGQRRCRSVSGDPEGRKMGRISLGRGHMALLPAGAAYRFHADRPGVLDDPDHPGPGDDRALGRDLPDSVISPDHVRGEETTMAMADSRIEAPTAANPRNLPLQSRLTIGPTNNGPATSFAAGGFDFRRDEYSPTSAGRGPAHHAGRYLPARPDARRRLGLLLRHGQFRQRLRHDESLRHGRDVRRRLQRGLSQPGATTSSASSRTS